MVLPNNPNVSLVVYDEAKRALLKHTICKGATDDELDLFIAQCQHTGLNPFIRQIWAIKRREYDKESQQWVERMGMQVGIDGYRLIAQRTGKYVGQLGPYWCGPDGQWTDIWLSEEPPAAAKFGVIRDGYKEPVWGSAKYSEYVQRTRDGAPNSMWAKMPTNQLAICAERQALRKAFPHELAGIEPGEDPAPDGESATGVIEGTASPVVESTAPNPTTESAASASKTVPPSNGTVPGAPPPASSSSAARPAANGKNKILSAAQAAGAMLSNMMHSADEPDLAEVGAKVKALVEKRSKDRPQPPEIMEKARGLASGKLDELLGSEEARHILVAAIFGAENGSLKSVTQPELFGLLDWMCLDRMDDGDGHKVYLSTPDTDVFLREANAVIADYRLQHGQQQMDF